MDEHVARKAREIMFVAHNVGGPGGMERHAEELIRRLLDAGHSVTVVARNCRLEPRPGLRVKRIRTPNRPFVLAYPAFFVVAGLVTTRRRGALLHTTGALIASRADVCTVHYCHHAAAAKSVGSRASRPGILSELNQLLGRVLSWLGESWCYRPRRARVLCAVSRGVAAELERAFPSMIGAIRTIPNGVDSARFAPDTSARQAFRDQLGLDPQAHVAVFAGGDWDRKGLSHAVEALAHAPRWHLIVAGAGAPSPLAATARREGTLDRLHFLGPVDRMPQVYAAADAFVFPTAYEAFPLVALEAAASGLPMLVTRVNGATELIEHGSSGWFIERDAKMIADRLNELLDDPDLGRSMAAQARARARRFSWEAMAEAYLAVYRELNADSPIDNRIGRPIDTVHS